MSATPNDTPVSTPGSTPIQPLHNPKHAALVAVPQAPLGNTTNGPANQAPGMGVKAMLAKRIAKNENPNYISPTDNLITPCSQKISAAKKKHFTRGSKPMKGLFSQKESELSDGHDSDEPTTPTADPVDETMTTDDNPF
ncbi:hypothetical protein EW146_g5229 [Bondarzewia mesenterica]|uniref:Spo12 family protein n=1 Tax=Bondarzewia mesenterica TaxID=1095465 RepID=A0A4S4LU69_9AGAM|nr:hypothetical protein EW146_g5229 [Bondarzewia mesenterica]